MNKKKIIIALIIVAVIFILVERMANSGVVPDFLHPTKKYAIWSFLVGGLSAISLIIGAIFGIIFNPKPKLTAALTAFGAGALLAALSVELIAPTVMSIVGQIPTPGQEKLDHSHSMFTMISLLVGCIFGGLLFYGGDELINSKGGYKRKVSTLIGYLKFKKSKTVAAADLEGADVMQEHQDEHKKDEHSGGPMAIWLGLLIDGIPESFVIGAGFLGLLAGKLAAGADPAFTDLLPYTLIAGLFLSNFPEALSSSVGMKKQGLSNAKILILWGSMVLIVAIGSVVGYFLGSEIPHEYLIGIEGVAAGAMLTMIAQTMIPEAVHIGGSKVVGLSTLIGFLSAVAFKLLEV